jgi:uncharacterized protein
MIYIEQRHLTIVQSILAQYPYTFYAFGSRTQGKQRKFSDLDVCFTEDIPWSIRAHIDDDFEQSELPFSIDIVDWQICNESFRRLIIKDLRLIQASKQFLEIEAAALAKFVYLSTKLGFDIQHSTNALIIDSGQDSSMFNVVCDIRLLDAHVDDQIRNIQQLFRLRTHTWWLGPSTVPTDLGVHLAKVGLKNYITECAMISDLATIEGGRDSSIYITKVDTPVLLQQFMSIIGIYNTNACLGYEKINGENIYDHAPFKLFVGFNENKNPVGIGTLLLTDTMASVFDLMTIEQKRGKEFESAMVRYIMHYAKELGYKQIVLCARDYEAAHSYEQYGFKTIGFFECYQ